MVRCFSTFLLAANVVFVALLFDSLSRVLTLRLHKRETLRHSPVILVPGYTGSQLEAKLDKPDAVHFFCDQKTEDYFSLWLNLKFLVPYVIDCWIDNMRLVYDNETRTTSNAPGVDIRVPDFGNTSSVEWVDPSRIPLSSYFTKIIKMLVTEGYTRGLDIRGAPYDFRKAPNEMANYFNSVKELTDETYTMNDNTKVTFVCHSMGCPVMSYFLNQQTQDWKHKYVKALVALSGAWGGAVKSMKAFASGDNFGVFVINDLTAREYERSSPSLAYLMPSDLLWEPHETLMFTENKNYTVRDFYDFFQDIEYPVGYEMFRDTYDIAHIGLSAPGVEVHCLHGMNVANTIEKLDFRDTNDFPNNPKLIMGDGDGTVNVQSLEACTNWNGTQLQKVFHFPLNNVDHMGILDDKHVLEYIKQIVHH